MTSGQTDADAIPLSWDEPSAEISFSIPEEPAPRPVAEVSFSIPAEPELQPATQAVPEAQAQPAPVLPGTAADTEAARRAEASAMRLQTPPAMHRKPAALPRAVPPKRLSLLLLRARLKKHVWLRRRSRLRHPRLLSPHLRRYLLNALPSRRKPNSPVQTSG